MLHFKSLFSHMTAVSTALAALPFLLALGSMRFVSVYGISIYQILKRRSKCLPSARRNASRINKHVVFCVPHRETRQAVRRKQQMLL